MSSAAAPRRSLRPAGGRRAGKGVSALRGQLTYSRKQLLQIRADMPVYGARCPPDLLSWLRHLGLEARSRPLVETTETHDGTQWYERREKRAGSDAREDWRNNHSDQQHDEEPRARVRKGKKDRNDLWDTPGDTNFNFSAASLPTPLALAQLDAPPPQQQQAQQQQPQQQPRADGASGRRELKKHDQEEDQPEEQRRRPAEQWKSAPLTNGKPKSKAKQAPAPAVRKVDSRFLHLLNAQSDATLDDLIDDDVHAPSDRPHPEEAVTQSTQTSSFKLRTASTDSEKLPRAIDVLMKEPHADRSHQSEPNTSSAKPQGGLESFMTDALRSLTIAPAGMTTPPRTQANDETRTGSRFLSWMQQTGEPEATPERPVSGFDESAFVFSIEDLIGEQPQQSQPQRLQLQHPPQPAMQQQQPAAPLAAQLQDLRAILPPGAMISTSVSNTSSSTGSVNLLEKLKFTEPALETPTKTASAATAQQPASNFTFHQQSAAAPRSSAKKPKRLVSAASRIVRTEQQTPGRASPVERTAEQSSPPPPTMVPSSIGTPDAVVARKSAQPPVHIAHQVPPSNAPSQTPVAAVRGTAQRISLSELGIA